MLGGMILNYSDNYKIKLKEIFSYSYTVI